MYKYIKYVWTSARFRWTSSNHEFIYIYELIYEFVYSELVYEFMHECIKYKFIYEPIQDFIKHKLITMNVFASVNSFLNSWINIMNFKLVPDNSWYPWVHKFFQWTLM